MEVLGLPWVTLRRERLHLPRSTSTLLVGDVRQQQQQWQWTQEHSSLWLDRNATDTRFFQLYAIKISGPSLPVKMYSFPVHFLKCILEADYNGWGHIHTHLGVFFFSLRSLLTSSSKMVFLLCLVRENVCFGSQEIIFLFKSALFPRSGKDYK